MLHLLAIIAYAAPLVTPEVMAGISLGGGAGLGPGSGGGSGGVAATWFPIGRLGINAGVREGVWASPTRTLGEIDAGIRYRASPAIDVIAGFVHYHETPWADFLGDPIGATAGVASGIDHRSGGQLGLSWGTGLFDSPNLRGVLRVDGTATVLAGVGPLAYGQVNAGFWLEVPTLRRRE